MKVKKSAEAAGTENVNEAINEELGEITNEGIDPSDFRTNEHTLPVLLPKSNPKLTGMTVDDLKILISEVVAAELQKWSNQSSLTVELESKDLDNSASKRPYLNSEGQYILLERTPEEISRQAQSIRDMFTEWEREYDAEEQRETFAYLQKALRDDFPSEGSFSENPLSVS